jgi:hypothetical protein
MAAKSGSDNLAISHHPQNTNQQYYRLTIGENKSATLFRQGNVGWYNFVNKSPILPGQRAILRLKTTNIKNECLRIGACT